MKLPRAFIFVTALVLLSSAGFLIAQRSTTSVATVPVYVPDTAHKNDPLPDGVLTWNNLMLTTNVPANASQAHFLFTFTNVAVKIDKQLKTNITKTAYLVDVDSLASPRYQPVSPIRSVSVTNIVWVTNSITPIPVAVLAVTPSCGCTTAKLPDLPWVIPAGGDGQIPITVNLENRPGTFFKQITFATDHGTKELLLQISVQPPVLQEMTEEERARGIAASKIDRQAVFHNDCATCHVKNGEGKYGKALFDADCAICHEAAHRASFVANLQTLKVPTNIDFWQTWISHGKPGSFMPAFSQTDGGPLTDMQIASLAYYLTQAFPSLVPPAPQ